MKLLQYNYIVLNFVLLFLLILASCSNKDLKPAKLLEVADFTIENKKQGFNPLKHGFNCDSLILETIHKASLVDKIIFKFGDNEICNIDVLNKKIGEIDEKDILLTDYNFDGFCDVVIKDITSAQHGGINHYYYLYHPSEQSFKENNSLPMFIASFKLDLKNQRVKIYCPYEDCYAYYKYKDDDTFELVKGEFKVNP